MQKNLIFIISLLVAMLITAGCQPHRIDIQQGNRIKPETLAQLKPGMTRSQVIFLLGTPLLQDPFHKDRWDYIYYLKPGNKEVRQSRVTLYFDGDTLSRIDDSGYQPEKQGETSTEDFDASDPTPSSAPQVD